MDYVLELKDISKSFGGVSANNKVNLNLKGGEILALVGENGAGKSTLMNMLYGLLKPDQGEIIINGKKVEMLDSNTAIENGIGMVFQHFMLIPTLTVAENVTLGCEDVKGMLLQKKQMSQKVAAIAKQYGMKIEPDAKIMDISLGMQQRVEILKTLYRNAKILILDEPTAVLTPQEVDELFLTIKELTKEGLSVIFITHKLKEVLEVSDRVTVLRRGNIIGTVETKDTNEQELAKMMVGRDVVLQVEKNPVVTGVNLVEVSNLSYIDAKKQKKLDDVSLSIESGEILGIAGVDGNGQSELEHILTGLLKPSKGKVLVKGQDISRKSVKDIKLKTKVGHVPEDRHKMGLILDFDIPNNIALGFHNTKKLCKAGVLNEKAISEHSNALVEKYDIRTLDPKAPVAALSGGNQQKIVIARELDADPDVLVIAHPTRGVDIGAIEFIHKQIIALREKGKAILLISADLNEVMSLSDRIAVLHDGKIVGEVEALTASETELGLMMAGISKDKGSEINE